MLSSAFTANVFFYSNEIALSPALPETLAPSFGASKPQHPNIPFAPRKSRLDVWVSNCQFCTEIGPLDNLASGTAIPLVGPENSRRLWKIAMMETVDSRELENVAGFG